MRPRGAGNGTLPLAGLLRRDERVHAQPVETFNRLCRVVTGVGGHLFGHCADVVYGFLHHRHRLLLVRSLVCGVSRHDHLVGTIHHRLTVVSLQEVPSARRRHDVRLRIGEVVLGLAVGNPLMALARGLSLLRSHLSFSL